MPPTYGCYEHGDTFYTQDPARFNAHMAHEHKILVNVAIANTVAQVKAARADREAEDREAEGVA